MEENIKYLMNSIYKDADPYLKAFLQMLDLKYEITIPQIKIDVILLYNNFRFIKKRVLLIEVEVPPFKLIT